MPSPQPQTSPSNAAPTGGRGVRRAVFAAITLALAAYALSGFYFVQPNQRGVVRWFGRIPSSQQSPPFGVGPGLHYAAPWPFCQVDTPTTTEVRRVFVGMTKDMREAIDRGETWAMRASPTSDVFTGDVNILKVTMAVLYQVNDPVAYLTGTQDPDELVRVTVQSVLTEEISKLPVDQALTMAKTQLESSTLARAQQRLDTYGCGVRLKGTNLESIEPPRAITSAFKDVVSAKKDGEKEIDRAYAEQNRILSRARGEASRLVQAAEAYSETRVKNALGDVDQFSKLLAEYLLAPDVTADRLRIQTFERVLSRVRIVVLDNKPGEPPTQLKIIDQSPD